AACLPAADRRQGAHRRDAVGGGALDHPLSGCIGRGGGSWHRVPASAGEREWFAARSAVRDRRRDSRAAVAVDIMAASPVVSATSLAVGLGIAVKNTSALLGGSSSAGS